MKDAKQTLDTRIRACIPFEGDESILFRKFLKSNGSKLGPYLRILALQAMNLKKLEQEVIDDQ